MDVLKILADNGLSEKFTDNQFDEVGVSCRDLYEKFVSAFSAGRELNKDQRLSLSKELQIVSGNIDEFANYIVMQTPSEPLKPVAINSNIAFFNRASSYAMKLHLSTAACTKELFLQGFNEIDNRLDSEPSKKVYTELKKAYASATDGNRTNKRWIVRLTKKEYARVLLFSKQLDISLSKLACYLVSYKLEKLNQL